MPTPALNQARRRHALVLAAVVLAGGCETLETRSAQRDPAKPIQLITLARTRLASEDEEFKNVLVIQTYLLDRWMRTVEARGDFTFHVYLDGDRKGPGVEPDFKWNFTREDAARHKTKQDIGVGYSFELVVPADEQRASRLVVIATYTHDDNTRLMSNNDLSNVPVVGEVNHSVIRSATPAKAPAGTAPPSTHQARMTRDDVPVKQIAR